MDYKRICSQEGYRREDLTEEQQDALSDIDYVIDKIRDLKSNLDYVDSEIDEETILGKLKAEIYNKVIDAVIEEAKLAQLEIQIAMAERDA